MSLTQTDPKLLEKVLNQSIGLSDQAEIFSLCSNSASVVLRNGQIREIQESEEAGVCLRIIRDGKLAQVSSSNLDQILNLPERAVKLAPYGTSVAYNFPGSAQLPDLTLEPTLKLDMETMIDTCRNVSMLMASEEPGLVTSVSANYGNLNIRILNSNGFDHIYTQPGYAVGAVGILAEEGNILTSYRVYIGQSPGENPEALGAQVLDLIRLGRNNIPFAGGIIPILLTPSAVSDVMAALGAGLSGSAVAKGLSPLTGKLGQKIVGENFSVIDDPLHPGAVGSQPFDDEGVPCRKKYLIRNGVLENYLLDLNSAEKLNLEPNGTGFRYTPLIKSRSFKPTPGPSFTNLLIPAGKRSSEEIIESLPRVLVIDQLTGVLLGNLTNGDWSGNVEYGILYEKGKPLGRVKNAMTGGNIYTMLNEKLGESSSDRVWVSGFGGSSGSSLLPYLLFDDMNISV